MKDIQCSKGQKPLVTLHITKGCHKWRTCDRHTLHRAGWELWVGARWLQPHRITTTAVIIKISVIVCKPRLFRQHNSCSSKSTQWLPMCNKGRGLNYCNYFNNLSTYQFTACDVTWKSDVIPESDAGGRSYFMISDRAMSVVHDSSIKPEKMMYFLLVVKKEWPFRGLWI